MKKTENASKAHAAFGYCKHLRPYGKKLAHSSVRRITKQKLKVQ